MTSYDVILTVNHPTIIGGRVIAGVELIHGRQDQSDQAQCLGHRVDLTYFSITLWPTYMCLPDCEGVCAGLAAATLIVSVRQYTSRAQGYWGQLRTSERITLV